MDCCARTHEHTWNTSIAPWHSLLPIQPKLRERHQTIGRGRARACLAKCHCRDDKITHLNDTSNEPAFTLPERLPSKPGGRNAPPQWLPWGVATVSLLAAYASVLWNEWRENDQYGFGLLVPPLAALLAARRWSDRPDPRPPGRNARAAAMVSLWGLVLVGGLFQLVYLSSPDWRFLYWFFGGWTLAFAIGFLFLSGGRPWVSHFAAPWLLLLTAIPWPTVLEGPLVRELLRIVTWFATEFLLLGGIAARQVGNTIDLSGNMIGVEEACSGIRSFQLALMVAIFLGEYYRLGMWRRILLIPTILCCGLALNFARVVALALLFEQGGSERMQVWHDSIGILAMMGIVFLGWGLAAFAEPTRATSNGPQPVTDTGVRQQPNWPSWMAIAGWAGGLAVGGILSEYYFRSVESKRGDLAARIEITAPPMDYLPVGIPPTIRAALHFTRGNAWVSTLRSGGASLLAINAVWEKGEISSFVGVHRPETCMPAGGYVLLVDEGVRTYTIPGSQTAVDFRCQKFGNSLRTLRVYHATGTTGTGGEGLADGGAGWHRLAEALAGHRVLGRWLIQLVVVEDFPEEDGWHHAKEFLDHASYK